MVVAKPERLAKGPYPNRALLDQLRSARLAETVIPEHEIIQFRRLQHLVSGLRVAGYDVEAMQTEYFCGGGLVAPIRCKVAVTRCDFDMEITDEVISQVGPRLPPDLVWLTTNATTCDPRVRALPIGVTDYSGFSDYHAIIGDTEQLAGLIAAHPRTEDNLVLMNFFDDSHRVYRPPVRAVFKAKPFVTESAYTPDGDGYAAYVKGLRTHAFCLAPRGNGIDTHRMWEALYAGAIPIVERCPAMKAFEGLPIFFVDRWEEACDEAVLKKKRDEVHGRTWDLRKLTLSWWYAEICRLLGAPEQPLGREQ